MRRRVSRFQIVTNVTVSRAVSAPSSTMGESVGTYIFRYDDIVAIF